MMSRCCSGILLLLALATVVVAVSDSKECTYSVFIRTGDRAYAGTDSKISLILSDSSGKSIKVPDLEDWGLNGRGYDYFERGNLDVFGDREICLSPPICKMKLLSNYKGRSPGWFVEYVELTFAKPHKQCKRSIFEVKEWMGINGPPYELEVVLDECKTYVV